MELEVEHWTSTLQVPVSDNVFQKLNGWYKILKNPFFVDT